METTAADFVAIISNKEFSHKPKHSFARVIFDWLVTKLAFATDCRYSTLHFSVDSECTNFQVVRLKGSQWSTFNKVASTVSESVTDPLTSVVRLYPSLQHYMSEEDQPDG